MKFGEDYDKYFWFWDYIEDDLTSVNNDNLLYDCSNMFLKLPDMDFVDCYLKDFMGEVE